MIWKDFQEHFSKKKKRETKKGGNLNNTQIACI